MGLSNEHISDELIDFVLDLAARLHTRSVHEHCEDLDFHHCIEIAQRMLARTEIDELTEKLDELFGEDGRVAEILLGIEINTRRNQ